MSLNDKEFLGTSDSMKRMDYQTALEIMDKVISSYLKGQPVDPGEKKVGEAYNIIRNG
tara:strand:+ start:2308 stop:2481 length:174 start_codon:yes stop_codon:yes gene_type:complete